MQNNQSQVILTFSESVQYNSLKHLNPQFSFECSYDQGNPMIPNQEKRQQVRLQIRNSFVVIFDNSTNKIQGWLECKYGINFQIIYKNEENTSDLGEPSTIIFSVNSQELSLLGHGVFGIEKLQFDIQNDDLSNFKDFLKALRKKTIVQLGFNRLYKAIRKIGKGSHACVYQAISKEDSSHVAIKCFKRSTYFANDSNKGKASFLLEWRIMSEASYPNICRLLGVCETQNTTYMIMELLSIPLSLYIKKFGFFSLQDTKDIVRQLLEGVKYLHKKKVMHRDLKLQNIMVRKEGKTVSVVIADFGLAEYTSSNQYLFNRCGTPGFVAPEILKIKSEDPIKTYTEACDIFSLGVIFNYLFVQEYPFTGQTLKEVIKKNAECTIDFTRPIYDIVGEQGKHFLSKMLSKDAKERMTAKQALDHPFLNQMVIPTENTITQNTIII